MKENYVYPVRTEAAEDGIVITFPDFPDLATFAEKREDVIRIAQEALALKIMDGEQAGAGPGAWGGGAGSCLRARLDAVFPEQYPGSLCEEIGDDSSVAGSSGQRAVGQFLCGFGKRNQIRTGD